MNVKDLVGSMKPKGDCKEFVGKLFTPPSIECWFKCLHSIPKNKQNYWLYQWSLVNGELFLNCRSHNNFEGMSVFDLCDSCADRCLSVQVDKEDLTSIGLISEYYTSQVKSWYLEDNVLYIKTKLFI